MKIIQYVLYNIYYLHFDEVLNQIFLSMFRI